MTSPTLLRIQERCEKGYLFGNGYSWYEFRNNNFYHYNENGFDKIIDEDEMRDIWFNKYRNQYTEDQKTNAKMSNPWGEAYAYIIKNVDSILSNRVYQYSIFDFINN